MTGREAIPKHWVQEWLRLPTAERVARSMDRLSSSTLPFSQLLAAPLSAGAALEHTIAYLHVPKAAGTTVEHVLAKNYRPHDVLHINGPVWQTHPNPLFKRGDNDPARVVMGHYHLASPIYQWLAPPLIHIVMLRDPVARIVSYYGYLRRRQAHPLHALATSLSIAEFLSHPDIPEARNGQTRRLSGWSDEPLFDATPEMHDVARNALDRCFSVVGVAEEFDEFMLLLQRVLGLHEPFAERKNTTPNPVQVSDEDRAQIEAANQFDLALYERARELFREQLNTANISSEHVADFRDRQNRWQTALYR